MLVKTITAFTLAHSITLAIATLGYASVPVPPLNAAIALSILFLGVEIVRRWRGETSFTIRHPWVVAFAFGLLHGFGFASGLTAMGLPRAEIPLALLLFNVGVEVGQLLFVRWSSCWSARSGCSRSGGLGPSRPSRATPWVRWAPTGPSSGRCSCRWIAMSGPRGQRRGLAGPSGRLAAGLAALASATPALAHVQEGQAQGLLNGLLHPISGLDHVLAMVSVGLWGAQLGPPALWLLP